MRAWEYESEHFFSADPLEEREYQGWGKAFDKEEEADRQLRELWLGFVPGSGAPVRLIVATVQAVENLGKRVSAWQKPVESGYAALQKGDMEGLIEATVQVNRAVRLARDDFEDEYHRQRQLHSFEDFRKASPIEAEAEAPSRHPPADRVLGSWVGQAVGDALGTAVEGYSSRQLRGAYGRIDGYVKTPSTVNDDITYQIVLLEAVLEQGKNLSTELLAADWAIRIPYAWSAEDVALRNILAGLLPPRTALTENPYREWIGAQMRGAAPGLLSGGHLLEAARLAWLDGSLSHTSNGILGEVFNALMVSRALREEDIRSILEWSIAMIPAETKYGAVIRNALETCKSSTSWDEAWARCEQACIRYHWIHSYPNACAEVAALWFGDGDFDRTAQIVAMEGMDADCNAAQVLSILGTALGAGAIPVRWVEPLGGRFETYLRGKKDYSFEELAEMSLEAMRKLRGD
jgi:ADP-ribosylglycohydrolase